MERFNIKNNSVYKNYFITLCVIAFPLIVFSVLSALYISQPEAYLKEFLAFSGMTFVFFTTILLINATRLKKILLLFFVSLLSVFVIIKLSFYHHYGVKISPSALFVLFETNLPETQEFSSYYIDAFVLFLILLFTIAIGSFIWWSNTSKFSISSIKKNKYFKVAMVLLSLVILYVIKLKLREENLVLTSYKTFKDYKLYKNDIKNNLSKLESNSITHVKSLNTEGTYIVIIGESTSKWHMQLYGYNRATNPALHKIKDSLYLFKDVITPHTHTILALQEILTYSNFENDFSNQNTSIVQLANMAGYKTYWLSNQRPLGIFESVPTLISEASKERYFFATDNFNYHSYDEVLLPKLEELLNKKEEKRIIFIHLIGTHIQYNKRYPKKFNHFKGANPLTKVKTKKAIKLVNEYDNAIRYNDSIVHQIIKKVEALNQKSYVVYFSDHGDDIFDTGDVFGHNEYIGSKPMYEVPLLVWLSSKFKNQNKNIVNAITQNSTKKYNLEDFIYSFIDLNEITLKESDSTKSIFNSHYKEKIRNVKDGIDYDMQK